MHKSVLAPALAGLLTMAAVAPAMADGIKEVTAPEVVTAIEAVFGVNPGQRRNHIKGTCARGEFVGNPEVARYSRSKLFSGQALPVIARFSLSGGNPNAPDTARSGRGMALQFRLPDGQMHHMALLNTPVFGAAHPQTFLDLMRALQADPATGKPNPENMKAFKVSHPDNQAQADFLASNNPPASYAGSGFWGIHTFKFINVRSQTTLVRWRFVPEDGMQPLSDEALKSAGANFLEQKLLERTRQGPVRWTMLLTLGQPGDPENDPTQAWPANRQEIRAGTLTISAASAQQGGECEPINFDPLAMADGIAPTDDPILRFRSPAYAVSFGKRLGGQ